MDAVSDLLSAGLIEKDSNGDVLWTWSYPTVRNDVRNLILKKCGLQIDSNFGKQVNFVYGHYQRFWYYLHTTEVFEADNLPKVKQFVLVLLARDLNPEKYDTLCRIMSKTYCKTGNPTALVKVYLSVVTRGSCSTEENGTFMVQHFEQKRSFANVGINAVINMFKLETILIYTAMLLKKRVIVYHHKLDSLLDFIRVLPAFVWHRQDWNILYPHVDFGTNEINDLKDLSCYAAGFLDASVETRSDLYDIFINLAAMEISVSPHAKGISFYSQLILKNYLPSSAGLSQSGVSSKYYQEVLVFI
ncbi:Protein fam45a [Chamberlinius hualienensis]